MKGLPRSPIQPGRHLDPEVEQWGAPLAKPRAELRGLRWERPWEQLWGLHWEQLRGLRWEQLWEQRWGLRWEQLWVLQGRAPAVAEPGATRSKRVTMGEKESR